MVGGGRFSLLTMCLEKADAARLSSLFEQLEQAQAAGTLPADEDLSALRRAYA